MSEVTVLDELVLPADAVDTWVELWRSQYLPGAQERGLELRGAWRGFTEDPAEVALVLRWTLPSVGAFFASRGLSGGDPAVRAFWEATDRLVIRRDRRVLADAGLVP